MIPFLVVMVPTVWILFNEPTDPQECVAVTVTGFWHGYKRQEFTVATMIGSDDTSAAQYWNPGHFVSEFDTLYRGPAVLLIRHGHWTGGDHLRLAKRCPPAAGGAANVVMQRDPNRPWGDLDTDSAVLFRILCVIATVYLLLFLIRRRFWKGAHKNRD